MAKLAPVPEPEYLDDDHQRIIEFASDFFDDDDERDTFVETLMTRRGYQKKASWAAPDVEQQPPPQQPQQQPQRQRSNRPAYFKR